MKAFSLFLKEEESKKERHTVLSFGRMSPPHIGHGKLVNKVHEVAKKYNADHHIVLSKTHDGKTNPLDPQYKQKVAKEFFPGSNIELADEENPTILHHAKKLNQNAEHLHVVAGGDRVTEIHQLLDKYNKRDYDYKSITVHSAGKRTPDGQGIEGVSSSRLRDYAKVGNFKDFARSIPKHLSDRVKKELFNKVRKGLGLKEHKALFVVGPQGSGKDIIISEVKKHFDIVETSLEQLQSRKKLKLEAYDNILISALSYDIEALEILETYLMDNGYDTKMIYAWISDEESRRRNEFRMEKTGRGLNEGDRHVKWIYCDSNRNTLEHVFENKFLQFDNSPSIDENMDILVNVFQEINMFLNKKNDINENFESFFSNVDIEESKKVSNKSSFGKFVRQGKDLVTPYDTRLQGGSFPYSLAVASESTDTYGDMSTVTMAGKDEMETLSDRALQDMKPEPPQKKSKSFKKYRGLDAKTMG